MATRAIKYHIVVVIALVATTFGIYHHTLDYPFVFDDGNNIQENKALRIERIDKQSLTTVVRESHLKKRPVANLTFALNYLTGKFDTATYRFWNIVIHILNGIVVYVLCLLLLREVASKDDRHQRDTESSIVPIAAVTALFWVSHPLQIQSVTYIVQRMNSLAVLFYLTALCAYIIARNTASAHGRILCFVLGAVSWVLALGSKEIAATLPLVIFVYEWYVHHNLSRDWLRQNVLKWGGLLFLFGLVAILFVGADPLDTIRRGYEKRDFTILDRVLTQSRVLVFYLAQTLYPHVDRLNLDHHFVPSRSFFRPVSTIICIAFIASFAYGAKLLARSWLLGSFCIVWFFIHHLVESTIVGLELAFEHRMYMPSIGLILLITVAANRHLPRQVPAIRPILAILIIVALSMATYHRNFAWESNESLWTDALKKSPEKSRTNNNYGRVLARQDKFTEAEPYFRKAIQLSKVNDEAHSNLGAALAKQGRHEEAVEQYVIAIRLNKLYLDARTNLAASLCEIGRINEAIEMLERTDAMVPNRAPTLLAYGIALQAGQRYEAAIDKFKRVVQQRPNDYKAYTNMGVSFARLKRFKDAVHPFKEAIRIRPTAAEAWYNLGNAYRDSRQWKLAVPPYQKALELNPTDADAAIQLGDMASRLSEDSQAVAYYQKAMAANPANLEAPDKLGALYFQRNNLDEAIKQWLQVIERNPNYAPSLYNLGNAYMRQQKVDDALHYYERTVAANPRHVPVRNNIAAALLHKERYDDAIRHYEEAIRLKPDYAEAKRNLEVARRLKAVHGKQEEPPSVPDESAH